MLNKSLLHAAIICLVFVSLSGCWTSKNQKTTDLPNGGDLVVSQNDLAFSVEEVTKEPGEEISFNFVNKLKDEKLRFYLLKNNEDPIVVQHIKAQQGGVPKEYFLFESPDVEPGQEVKVEFQAPLKEGVYSFVGVGATPRESLVGRLVIAKKELPVNDENEIGKGLTDESI